MLSKLQWLLRRPAVVFRTAQKLGWDASLRLALIRLRGRRDAEYTLRLKGFPYPVTIRGGQSSDAHALYEILVLDEYGFAGDLGSPSFIIDGGANIGMASLFLLNRYPGVHIVAVEPSPANFAICQKNLAPYGDRVVLVQGAIWKDSGRLVLDETVGEEWRTKVRAGEPHQAGSVEAFTIPQLIARGWGKVDLLKVDVEGGEREIFGPGAKEWLPQIRNVVIELHGQECSDRFFNALAGYDYQLVRSEKDALPVVACRNLQARSTALAT
jgi:FkbM family methyltransferase